MALLELACSVAPDDISTAAIAERMGVSHAALFRHFPSREALWGEAVGWAITELTQRFEQAADRHPGDSLEKARALLLAHLGFLQDHPGLVRMFFAELQRPQSSPAHEQGKAFMHRFRGRLAELIAMAQREHRLDGALESAELASLLVAINQGLMLQGLAQNSLDGLVERAERAHRLMLAAFSPRATGGAHPAAAPGE
jgi:TetR/AcrR family transcriptional regulator